MSFLTGISIAIVCVVDEESFLCCTTNLGLCFCGELCNRSVSASESSPMSLRLDSESRSEAWPLCFRLAPERDGRGGPFKFSKAPTVRIWVSTADVASGAIRSVRIAASESCVGPSTRRSSNFCAVDRGWERDRLVREEIMTEGGSEDKGSELVERVRFRDRRPAVVGGRGVFG